MGTIQIVILLTICLIASLSLVGDVVAQGIPITIPIIPDDGGWFDASGLLIAPIALSEQTFTAFYNFGDPIVLDLRNASTDLSQVGAVGLVNLTGGSPQE